MNPHPEDDRLQDYVDGSLATAERDAVARHLEVCADCRRSETRLRALLADTRALPRAIEPPRDLWGGIAERIDRRAGRPARRWPRVLALAAAVLALMAATSLVTWRLARDRPPVAASPVPLPRDLRAIEADYVQATDDVARVLTADLDRLAPETVAIIERNLRIIDDAIRDARGALARDPSNHDLARMLWSAYNGKLDLLQRATRIAAGT